jgi:cytochrome P450
MTNLKVELTKAIPDPLKSPDLRVLEKLPYLNACIKEALRISSGVISGLPRVVRPGGAIIDGEEIPGGTIVSIGSTFVHYNSHIFVSPHEFRPERWLQNPELDHWLVAFSRAAKVLRH